jgi:hypothetical protein
MFRALPLPRPAKILCHIGDYRQHTQREPRPLHLFFKSPGVIIGSADPMVRVRNGTRADVLPDDFDRRRGFESSLVSSVFVPRRELAVQMMAVAL